MACILSPPVPKLNSLPYIPCTGQSVIRDPTSTFLLDNCDFLSKKNPLGLKPPANSVVVLFFYPCFVTRHATFPNCIPYFPTNWLDMTYYSMVKSDSTPLSFNFIVISHDLGDARHARSYSFI